MHQVLEQVDHPPPAVALGVGSCIETETNRFIRLHDMVGRGADATVFRAEYVDSGEQVAVKLFAASLLLHSPRIRRVSAERVVAERVGSERLVRLLDAGVVDSRAFLVMEYADGGSLQQYVDAHAPLTMEEVRTLGIELCEAVGDLHAHDIVHRDLKPQNVLRCKAGRLKLADYGLALPVGTASETTLGGDLGTMAYVAPEQALGCPADFAADIYALGVMFFVMATGKLPFDASTPLAAAMAHIKDSAPVPSTIDPDLPRAFDAVVIRCMAKDAKRRYKTTRDLQKALSRVPVHSDETVWTRARIQARRALLGVPAGGA